MAKNLADQFTKGLSRSMTDNASMELARDPHESFYSGNLFCVIGDPVNQDGETNHSMTNRREYL
jgi:hypothetical protein